MADDPGSPNVARGPIEDPTLATVTEVSLDVLSQDPDGFFLVLEQGDIDWSNHANDFENMVGGVWDLDQAVRTAEAWVGQAGGPEWSDTLMILASDHANSYLRLRSRLGAGDLPLQVWLDESPDGSGWSYPDGQVTYQTNTHTNELVTLWAKGQGAELFESYVVSWYPQTEIVDNTQIYEVMVQAVEASGVNNVILFIGDGMHLLH